MFEGTASIIIVIAIIMYFNRSIKQTAVSLETSVDLGYQILQNQADAVELNIHEKYGKLGKRASKLSAKGMLMSRKDYRNNLKTFRASNNNEASTTQTEA